MKKFFKRNLYKVALIVTMAAVATVAVTAGTFAALSAEYTWKSDKTEAGEFNYADTTYNFDLFKQETVFPGNSGSGSIEKPDFNGDAVVWDFAEENEGVIPMVYYFLDNEGNPTKLYSQYDFATVCADKYIKLSDKFVACNDISSNAATFATGFVTDNDIYWAWPSEIFADAEGTAATVEAYDLYNANLCTVAGAFTNAEITFLNGSNGFPHCSYFATAENDGAYTVITKDTDCILANDKIKYNGNYIPVFNNTFKAVVDESVLKTNDCIVFFTSKTGASALKETVTSAGVNVEIDESTRYAIDG
ncbi:MAG: hypothetical protein MJ193_03300, partial [Clostridia bacterium]|nr:hypothetical protein [Clostridia bacterium]